MPPRYLAARPPALRATPTVAVLPEAPRASTEWSMCRATACLPLPSHYPPSLPHPHPHPHPRPMATLAPPPARRFSRGGRRGLGGGGTPGGANAQPPTPAIHAIPPRPQPPHPSRRCASRSPPAQASHAAASPARPPRSHPHPRHRLTPAAKPPAPHAHPHCEPTTHQGAASNRSTTAANASPPSSCSAASLYTKVIVRGSITPIHGSGKVPSPTG